MYLSILTLSIYSCFNPDPTSNWHWGKSFRIISCFNRIASHRIAHAGNPPVLTSRPWCDCHSTPSPRSRTQDIENTHCPSSECVVEPFVLLLLLPSRHLQYPNYIPSLHSATASTTHSGQKHTGHHFHELNLLLLFLYPPTTPRYPSELYRASRLRLSLQFRHPGER